VRPLPRRDADAVQLGERAPDVVVLGISVDRAAGPVSVMAKKWGLSFPIVMDDGATSKAYDITTLPTTVVVAPDGKVKTAHTGVLAAPQLDLMVW
jgi:peroxiredoxin